MLLLRFVEWGGLWGEQSTELLFVVPVFAGRKCELCASDGTFCEANVGGDDDEKYEDDFSIAEYSTVACGRMFGAGMCFANLKVERVFLYFHYEYVKCEFG